MKHLCPFFPVALFCLTVRVNFRKSHFRRRKLDIRTHISLQILASDALQCHGDDASFFARAFIRKFHQFRPTNILLSLLEFILHSRARIHFVRLSRVFFLDSTE